MNYKFINQRYFQNTNKFARNRHSYLNNKMIMEERVLSMLNKVILFLANLCAY